MLREFAWYGGLCGAKIKCLFLQMDDTIADFKRIAMAPDHANLSGKQKTRRPCNFLAALEIYGQVLIQLVLK